MVIEHTKPLPLGEQLRLAREQQGLSIADVAASTKFHAQQIAALEAGDLARLPSNAFVRGFVRSYAKLLQLDAAPLLAALPAAIPPLFVPDVTEEVPFTSRLASRRRQNIVWLTAAGGVMLLAIAFAIWSFNTPKNVEIPVPQPLPQAVQLPEPVALAISAPIAAIMSPVAASAPSVLTSASAVALTTPLLRLTFDEDAWVEVRDQMGKNLSSQLNLRGSQLDLEGPEFFNLQMKKLTLGFCQFSVRLGKVRLG